MLALASAMSPSGFLTESYAAPLGAEAHGALLLAMVAALMRNNPVHFLRWNESRVKLYVSDEGTNVQNGYQRERPFIHDAVVGGRS